MVTHYELSRLVITKISLRRMIHSERNEHLIVYLMRVYYTSG